MTIGLPAKDTTCTGSVAEGNDRRTPCALIFRNVPVDAFWSVSVYDKDGYFEPDRYNACGVNDLTGTPDKDGSFTIHFGGDPAGCNFRPIT